MKENGPKKTETPEEKELHRGKGTLRRIQSDESRRYGEEHRRKPEDGVDETVEMRDGGDRPVCERGYNLAIVLTGYQIVVGNWQFDRSGPDYTWFMLDRMEPNVRIKADVMSTQSTFAMVLANSGRTEDTVISLSRDTKHAESMRICMPEFDRKGGYKAGSAVLNDKGSFGLAPGESKLLFAVAPRTSVILTGQTDKGEEYRSESFEVTGNLTVYSASGKTWPAKELHPDQRVIRHYEDLSGFRQAKKDCMSLVNKDMGVK